MCNCKSTLIDACKMHRTSLLVCINQPCKKQELAQTDFHECLGSLLSPWPPAPQPSGWTCPRLSEWL